MLLSRNWTNALTARFQDLNSMYVLKFKNCLLKKPGNLKMKNPFFCAKAEYKFDNCKLYTFLLTMK